jgi:hypothetical protein
VRLVRVGKASALVFVGTVTVREEGTPVLRMLAVQLGLAAMVAVAHAPRELVKSMGLLPPAEILEMCSGDVPVLEMVTEMGVLASP